MVQFKKYLFAATKYQGGRGRQENDPDIIKLSSNENQFGSSPLALAAITESLSRLHEYPDNDDFRLRNALAIHYHHRLNESQFICAPGASEIIELLCRAFLDLNSEVITSSPTFIPFTVFSEKMGARVVDVPLEREKYHFQVDMILEKINKNTRLIFLASPNNPTGSHIPKNELEFLLDRLPEHVLVVFDEVYYPFATAPDYCTAMEFVKNYRNIFAINSFSKVYGLAGLRLGYGYGPLPLVEYVRHLSKPFLNSTLALNAGIAALQDTLFVDKTITNNLNQKEYLYDQFEKMNLEYWPTQANFILVKPDMPVADFVRNLFNYNIMVRPVGENSADESVRITIGTPSQNIKLVRALEAISQNLTNFKI